MGKVRVYELAKELNMSNKELVKKLQEMGYPVKSHSSTLEDFLLQEIKDRLQGKKAQVEVESKARPTVIRRRKKAASAPDTEADVEPEPESAAQQLSEWEPTEVSAEQAPQEPVEQVPVETAAEKAPAEPESMEEPSVEDVEEPVIRKIKAPRHFESAKIISTPPEEAEPPVAEEPIDSTAEEIAVVADTDVVPDVEPVEESEVREVELEPVLEAEAPEEAEIITAPESDEDKEITEKIISDEETEILEETKPVDEAEPAVQVKAIEPEGPEKPIKLVKPAHKPEPKIKRIEKVTSEPARIISKPKPVEIPVEPKKPVEQKKKVEREQDSRPRQKPRPAAADTQKRDNARDAKPPRIVPRDVPPEPEAKKGRKRKKGKEADSESGDSRRKKGVRRREIIERTELYDGAGWERSARGRKSGRAVKKIKKTEITIPKAIKRRIKVVEAITVAELAKKMGIKAGDIIKKLITMGMMANINQALDFDTAVLVASEFGYEVEQGSFDEENVLHLLDEDAAQKVIRPPVVTVMGHVDHGKTSLLDAIRKTNVIEGEAGGITQHIGAYHVNVDGGQVTFLDTPGHAAFTAMRSRGAQITDIVVLIVAADDGVMQQTREAADHARAAGVPIIVAVNKIDKPEADTVKIRREVSELGLVPEEWGGDTIFADISAKQGIGVDELLEMILLQAEVLELKASSEGRAKGRIIEARLDKGRGPVATILVQSGLLKQGDPYVCGVYHGKVRAMFNDKGQRVDEAGPSMPVEIQGISGVPQAGDEFVVVEDEKQAKQVSQHRLLKQRENELIKTSKLTLENLFDNIKEGAIKELNLVLKADVQGSLEAISDALEKLGTEEIKINLITSSTGSISETDINLASASNGLVVGFNVRPNAKVQDFADTENVQIRFYDVIYKLIDEIKVAMAGLLEPILEEKVLGRAEVRETFHVSKVGTIAGCGVSDGKIIRGSQARLLRNDIVIYDGKIDSLKRFKDDAKEVVSGYECGIGLEGYNDIKIGDVIEAYLVEEIAATLD